MHRRIVPRVLDIYTSTDCLAIDGGEVFSGLGLVESPDCPGWYTIVVIKLTSAMQPYSNNSPLELFKLIIISNWRMVRKLNNHRTCLSTYTQFVFAVVRFRVLVLQFCFAVVRCVLDTVFSNQTPFYWCEQRGESSGCKRFNYCRFYIFCKSIGSCA